MTVERFILVPLDGSIFRLEAGFLPETSTVTSRFLAVRHKRESSNVHCAGRVCPTPSCLQYLTRQVLEGNVLVMAEPTRTQIAAIIYFNGGPVPPANRMSESTYAVCRRNGWIKAIDDFPFHRTTDKGRELIMTRGQ
jgi:hypothetical protein